MDHNCVSSVEKIINYKFNKPNQLVEALTHSSCIDTTSYERLEFVGDAALGLAFANFVYLTYPGLEPGIMTRLRAANISTEKLARVAVKTALYRYVRLNDLALHAKVQEFALAVESEEETVVYGGAVKAPKVLADIVESVIGAVYGDCDFNLKFLWQQVIRHLLEPIITLETLPLQPVTMLCELYQKQGQHVHIKDCRKIDVNVCTIYVDGKVVATGTSDHKDIARLNAAKEALAKFNQSDRTSDHKDIARLNAAKEAIAKFNQSVIHPTGVVCEVNDNNEIEAAKQKLHDACGKKKWPKPVYRIEKELGLTHEKTFICSVKIETAEVVLHMMGEEKSSKRHAENSAASLMIHSLVESNYV